MADAPERKQLNTDAIHALHLCMWAHTVAVEAKLDAMQTTLDEINAKLGAGITVKVETSGI